MSLSEVLKRDAPAQVLPCSIRHVHDWSSCNFTHPGEKARRRDPQTHSYTGIACPDMKKVRAVELFAVHARRYWACYVDSR